MADPKWKTHLTPVYRTLVEGIRVTGPLLDNLVQDRLFTLSERSEVDHIQPSTEENKARHMVELLRKKEANSFDIFCSVLGRIGYRHLANALLSGDAGLLQDGIQLHFQPPFSVYFPCSHTFLRSRLDPVEEAGRKSHASRLLIKIFLCF